LEAGIAQVIAVIELVIVVHDTIAIFMRTLRVPYFTRAVDDCAEYVWRRDEACTQIFSERHRLPTMFVMHEANDSASDFCSSITDLKPTELAYRRLIGLTSAQSSSLS
jgi:hypothetical protein